MRTLFNEIQQCEVCKDHLPCGSGPVIQLSTYSKIAIIGQAPGLRVHKTRIPWNDASGVKSKEGLNVDEVTFYTPLVF